MLFRRCLIALLVLGPAFAALAPAHAAGSRFFAVSVPDLARSEAWYARAFGLRPSFRYAAPDDSVRLVVLEGAQLSIELQQHRGAQARSAPPDSPFLQHGVFKVGVAVDDLDASVQRLQAAGARLLVAPFAQGGRRSAVLSDPDGTFLQLMQTLSPAQPAP